MKLAVFSDIHGNYQALDAILSDIKNKYIDKVICLGDTIGLGPSPNECLKLLNENNVKHIMGNHELEYLKNICQYKKIGYDEIAHNEWTHNQIKEKITDDAVSYEITIGSTSFLFIHFFLSHQLYPFESSSIFESDRYKEIMSNLKYDYVFYGHIHTQRVDEVNKNHYYALDSSGCTKDDNTFYYIIDTTDGITVNKVNIKYNRDAFVRDLLKEDYPNRREIAEKFFGINI